MPRTRHTAKRRSLPTPEPVPATPAPNDPAYELLAGAGLYGLACLQSWLWTEGQDDPVLVPHRYRDLAPHASMQASAMCVLATSGFLKASAVQSHLWPSRAESATASGWRLADEFGSTLEAEMMISLALSRARAQPSFVDEACELWRALATAEIVSYLAAELLDHQFEEQWAWALQPLIAAAVPHMAIAHGFYFCWLAVRDLASAYLRFPAARERLPHTLRHAFESKLSRAHTEGWTTRRFDRHIRRPESAMASVFSAMITQLGEGYLHLAPCPENLRF